MTKIDKLITSKLHSIIQKCIANKIDTNTIIIKIDNAFFNAQQMVTQLDIYLVFSLICIFHLKHLNSLIHFPLNNALLC
jgi:hypothetical protein